MAQIPIVTNSERELILMNQGIEPIYEAEELRDFLVQERVAHVYLLGKLDPSYFQFCRWFGQRDESGALEHLVLLYQGLSIPVVFAIGGENEDTFEQFLKGCVSFLPDRFHFHVAERHMRAFRKTFQVTSYQKMHRMGLEASKYQAMSSNPRVEMLGHRDTGSIMELYEHFPDAFFEPYQLETGLYFGVKDEEENKLLSIAGVHVISPEYNVAVIGNLVTHPDARGQRLATSCTGTLLDALFERVSFVALNVQTNNTPAIRMYTNFGFEPNHIFFEGRCND